MADAFIQVPDDSANTGKKVDNDTLTVGANTVLRQRTRVAGAAAAELQDVRNAAPGASDYGAVTRVGDGHNVAVGATADAAVVTDAAGTLSGKLRGLIKWAFERMPAALGQTTMAASLPVAIASNQSPVPVSDAALQAALLPAQGVVTAALTGPMVQAPVSDTPNSYLDGTLQPLSLTNEGRLRVSAQPSDARADVWGDLETTWCEPQADSYAPVEWAERSIW